MAGKTFDAVLLVNLGSPASPEVKEVRRYLRQFLMDGRVIDVPYPLRKLIVELFILPFRPRKSSHAYQTIWWEEGSPLIVISQRVQQALQNQLDIPVFLSMRYGHPSIKEGILQMLESGIRKFLLVPLYPHYAMSTVETVVVETRKWIKKLNAPFTMEILPPFYDDPLYIQALLETAAPYLRDEYDHLIFSYHGIPLRHLKKTDPTGNHCLRDANCCHTSSLTHFRCYRYQVQQTTAAFVKKAGIPANKFSITFQSRLGMDAWLQPFTDREMIRLAQAGVKNLKVICPAFVVDCLETLEEIGIRGKETFLAAGGTDFELIPCLNDHPVWIETLRKWITGEAKIQTSTIHYQSDF